MPQRADLQLRPTTKRTSLYRDINDAILTQLEAGQFPCVQLWGPTARAGLALP